MKTHILYPILISTAIFSCTDEGHQHAKDAPQSPAGTTLMLSESQVKLAHITTVKLSTRDIGLTEVVNARVLVDEDLSEVISSRSAGRIERLYTKETGRLIKKGEPLYELYSEMLMTLQQEYLLALGQFETLGKNESRYESILKAAEQKLLLYGLVKNQIEALAQSKSSHPRITILSPASGLVSQIAVNEGQYVSEGVLLYKLENLKKIWVESELYPHETEFVRLGSKVKVFVVGYESTPFESTVTFLNPEFGNNSQIIRVRTEIENPGQRFKPGMQAQVQFSHSQKKTIALPVDAVIRNSKGNHVYVKTATRTFEPRMVKTGIEDVDLVEITEGLQEGEEVVVTGAYLLYSEWVLRKGSDPMAGHQH